MNKKISALTAIAIASTALLAACGGGGGGGGGSTSSGSGSSGSGSTSTSPAATATSSNVSTPQYTSGSAQSEIFSQVNAYRQQCGFPALTENTQLDTASLNHAKYMAQNSVPGDSETSGNPGYTGATYQARAVAAGYPGNVYVGGVSDAAYTNATLTGAQYGQDHLDAWLGGVYHVGGLIGTTTVVGIGETETPYQGFPQSWAAVTIANLQSTISNGPLTFPCQGTTGVPYKEVGEIPTPPNVGSSWGTPILVAGNPTDTITLTAGTVTDGSGNVTNLSLLSASNDPNKLLSTFQAVAYPTTALQPNTTYTVSLTGTVNGAAFSRSFSFTTGNGVG